MKTPPSGAALAVLLLMLASGGAAAESPSAEELELLLAPRMGIYIPIPAKTAPRSPGRTRPIYFPGGPPTPVFLNRNGGTYYRGNDDSGANISSIVPNQSAQLDGFAGGDGVWNQVLQCVRTQFSRFNVEVTDQQPTRAHVEAVIGGSPDSLGLPSGVGGVAPIDPYDCDVIESAVVYVFTDVLPNNAQIICEVAAQEIAHSFSLDHALLCQDPMTYLSGCGSKSFQNVDSQCGEYQSRDCICDRTRQNSVAVMLEKLGPATTDGGTGTGDIIPPTVSVQSPATGTTLPANSVIQIVAAADDDVAVTSVELIWPYNGNIFPCPVTAQNYTCALSGGTATWSINVGTGTRSFQVRARDAAGNESVSPSISITLTTGGVAPPDDTNPPVVGLVSPEDGAVLPANSRIEVVATATDDVSLASMELVWPHTNESFSCPSNTDGVTCTQSGSTYTWSLPVGIGTRPFQARATDLAGHLSLTPLRTLILDDGSGPPPDVLSPQVIINRPSDGATLSVSSPVDVVATVTDNVGVDSVTIVWDGSVEISCPGSQAGATCTRAGTAYTWSIPPVLGAHTFSVRAEDAAGNQKLTAQYSVTVAEGGSTEDDDAQEDNDTFETAKPVTCGGTVSLVSMPLDPDWFVVGVPVGTPVTVAVDSVGQTNLDLLMAKGPLSADVLALATGPALDERISVTSPSASLAILVQGAGGGRGEYTLTVTCEGQGGQPDDNAEPNNTPAQATRMFCGQTASYVAKDDDHYAVDVREGDTLTASWKAGSALTVELLAEDGSTVEGAAATDAEASINGRGLAAGNHVVRVRSGSGEVAYELTMNCAASGAGNPDGPVAVGCAHTQVDGAGGGSGLALLALVWFVRRRR